MVSMETTALTSGLVKWFGEPGSERFDQLVEWLKGQSLKSSFCLSVYRYYLTNLTMTPAQRFATVKMWQGSAGLPKYVLEQRAVEGTQPRQISVGLLQLTQWCLTSFDSAV